MYGCDRHIGCLSGSVTRVGSDGNGFMGLSGSVTRVGDGLRGYASLVCSVNKDAYLRTSTDVVWLSPDMIAEVFEIYSNAAWRIE